jgi:hypothetical protein
MVALSFLLIDRFIIYIVVVVGVGDIGDNSKKPRIYAAYRRKILWITGQVIHNIPNRSPKLNQEPG